jgi:hypothetical protein
MAKPERNIKKKQMKRRTKRRMNKRSMKSNIRLRPITS